MTFAGVETPAWRRLACRWLVGLGLLGSALGGLAPSARAYPPALPHTFYGMIRDELGHPLAPGASIVLESAAGVKVFGVVSGLLEPGVNYRLRVPLDAGLTRDAYRPTALNPKVPFKVQVTVGGATFLPIEMTHDFALMGQPGKSTRLDLTLGEDLNGDGIPDAWQRRLSEDIDSVRPGDDLDGDGLSNLDEYLAGTYAADPAEGFQLELIRIEGDRAILEFLVVLGRTYTVYGSTDLDAWLPMGMRIVPAADASPTLVRYSAADSRILRVEAVSREGDPVPRFFKVQVQ